MTRGIAIQKVSQTSYNFYYSSGIYSGTGFFVFNTNDTFTYSGTSQSPSGCYIIPTLRYSYGIGSLSVSSLCALNNSLSLLDNYNNLLGTFLIQVLLLIQLYTLTLWTLLY